MNEKKKKILIISVSIVLTLAILGTAVYLIFFRAPRLEEIYDRVVELVEASYEVNTVFYGAGLPVYAEDSEYAEMMNLYYDNPHRGYYEYVSPYAKFQYVDAIRQAAERVYSTAYLEEVLYPNAFDGYAIGDGMGGSIYSQARYFEEDPYFYHSSYATSYIEGMRIYDYSTMKVVLPSTARVCYITMSSWMEDAPDDRS